MDKQKVARALLAAELRTAEQYFRDVDAITGPVVGALNSVINIGDDAALDAIIGTLAEGIGGEA